MNNTKEFHPVAAIFPLLEEDELQDLATDIKVHGQKNPIWLHDDKIVDGRNRYKACQIAGVAPRFEQWDGNGLLTDFVWSLNALRRQMDDGQRAMSAARYAAAKEEESKARQVSHLKHQSSLESIDSNDKTGRSRDDAAEKFKTSAKTVQRATTVLKNGADELVKAVESGQVAVSAAAEIASLPKEEQVEAVKAGKAGIKAATQKAKQQKPKKSKSPEGAETVVDTLTPHEKERAAQAKALAAQEEALDDEQWLLALPPYRWLLTKNRHIFFRRAALAYRRHSKAIVKAQKALRNDEAMKMADGSPFAKAISPFLGIKHPRFWPICGCKGNGCARCNSTGYDLAAGLDAVVLLGEAEEHK